LDPPERGGRGSRAICRESEIFQKIWERKKGLIAKKSLDLRKDNSGEKT